MARPENRENMDGIFRKVPVLRQAVHTQAGEVQLDQAYQVVVRLDDRHFGAPVMLAQASIPCLG
jgi:hypothetical protein